MTISYTFRQWLAGVWTDEALLALVGQEVPVAVVGLPDTRLPTGQSRYRITGVTRVTQADWISPPPGQTDVLVSFEPLAPPRKEPQPSGEEPGTMPHQEIKLPTVPATAEWSIEVHRPGVHVIAEGTRDEIGARLIQLGNEVLRGLKP